MNENHPFLVSKRNVCNSCNYLEVECRNNNRHYFSCVVGECRGRPEDHLFTKYHLKASDRKSSCIDHNSTAAVTKLHYPGNLWIYYKVFIMLQHGTYPLNKALKKMGVSLEDLKAKLKAPVAEGGGLVNVLKDIKRAGELRQ